LAVGMAPYFSALAKEAGVDFKAMATVGTRIDQWANNADLKKLLETFQPELVLVSLGTNDSFMQGKDVVTKQQAQLEKLYALLTQWPRSRDYGLGAEHIVWIGPPTLPKPRRRQRALAALLLLPLGKARDASWPRQSSPDRTWLRGLGGSDLALA